MLKRSVRLTASAAALLTATTAFAEPTVEELDVRMRAMENTMQSILELLQEQQAAVAPPAAAPADTTAETTVTVPADYQMGALYLDVFTKVFSQDERNAMFRDPAKLPDGPDGTPMGSALIKPPSSFDYGALMEEPELAGFANADALLGLSWSGVLEVRNDGPHTLSLQIKKTGQQLSGACRSVLRMSGKSVADVRSAYEFTNEQVDVAQTVQELSQGLYDVSLWTICVTGDRGRALEGVSTSLAVAGPGDRAPKPIQPERFGVKP